MENQDASSGARKISTSEGTAAAPEHASQEEGTNNPLGATTAETVVGESVVPSLMQVYESMTGGAAPAAPPPTWAVAPGAAAWNTATGISNSIPIPPVPTNYQHLMPAPAHPPQPEEQPPANAPGSHPPPARGGRPTRKRSLREVNQPAATSADTGLSVMATAAASRSKKSRRKSTGGSGDSGNENSKSNNDGRWSKRFTWPEELHRDFVSAIFDVGLKHSSPSTLLEQMPKHEQITTERIKSHLQKYRLHRVKSKQEFMHTYTATLQQLQAGTVGKDGSNNKTLNGGSVAGQLTYAAMTNKDTKGGASAESATATTKPASATEEGAQVPQEVASSTASTKAATATTTKEAPEAQTQKQPESLLLPRLTEAEKKSPVGMGMGYLMGLFFSLQQQLMAQRAAEQEAKKRAAAAESAPITAVYNSFVSGPNAVPSTTEAVQDPLAVAAGTSAAVVTNPSTRTNLEENTIMKREMQSQMVFQNKMRALKQQELEKYKGMAGAGGAEVVHHAPHHHHQQQQPHDPQHHPEGGMAAATSTPPEAAAQVVDPQEQGAGEPAATGDAAPPPQQRARGLSIGAAAVAAEEFWNTDMVDDQLFEFLMSDA